MDIKSEVSKRKESTCVTIVSLIVASTGLLDWESTWFCSHVIKYAENLSPGFGLCYYTILMDDGR